MGSTNLSILQNKIYKTIAMKNIQYIASLLIILIVVTSCGGGKEEVGLLDRPLREVMNMNSTQLAKEIEGMDLAERKKMAAEFKSFLKPTELKINQIEKTIRKEDSDYTGEQQKKSKLVSLTKAEVKDVETFFEATGSVKSKDDTKVMAETTGRITGLGLVEDRYLKKGDFVMSVDDETVKRSIDELGTQLELAKTVLEKRDRLWAQKIGTEKLIQAKSNVEALEKSIATAQSNLDKFNQNATVSGMIETVFVNEGEMVMAGSPLASIINLSTVTVQAELVEAYLSKVKRGDKVMVEFPSLDIERKATITDIGARLDAGSRSFTIEMDISNPDYKLKPNILAMVKVRETFIKDAVVIPTSLVQSDFGGEYIFITDAVKGKQIAKKVSIETGDVVDNQTIVTKGLIGGETLIDKGFRNIVEGQPVEASAK